MRKLLSIFCAGGVKTLNEPVLASVEASQSPQVKTHAPLAPKQQEQIPAIQKSISARNPSVESSEAVLSAYPVPSELPRAISRRSIESDASLLFCQPKDLIGDVRELRWVGQGSQGVVFEGYFQGALVAVKWCIAKESSSIKDLTHELLISGSLGHPCVVQTFSTKVALLNDEIFQIDSHPRRSSMCPVSAERKRRDSFLFPETALDSFGSGEGFGDPCPRASISNLRDVRDMLRLMGARPGQYLTQQIMEYCDQGSLLAAITHGVFCPAAHTCPTKVALRALYRTAREVAQGMLHLHQNNIVHGDLKPANVLLTSSRRDRRGFIAKVSDFGLAAYCPVADGVVENAHWGTMVFMAPERFTSNQMLPASDVWSFGVLMWQMYTMRPPYKGARNAKLVEGIIANNLRLSWPSDSPPAFVNLVNECMAYEPSQRPTFKALVNALTEMEHDLRMECTRLSTSFDVPRSPADSQEDTYSPAPNPNTPATGAPHHAAMSRSPMSRTSFATNKPKPSGNDESPGANGAGRATTTSPTSSSATTRGPSASSSEPQVRSPQPTSSVHQGSSSDAAAAPVAAAAQPQTGPSSTSSGINQAHHGSSSISSGTLVQDVEHDSHPAGHLQPDARTTDSHSRHLNESDEYMSIDEHS